MVQLVPIATTEPQQSWGFRFGVGRPHSGYRVFGPDTVEYLDDSNRWVQLDPVSIDESSTTYRIIYHGRVYLVSISRSNFPDVVRETEVRTDLDTICAD